MKASILTIFIFIFLTNFVIGQSGSIQGIVMDVTTKDPIPFASIYIYIYKNDTIFSETVADIEGNFKIEKLPIGQYKIIAKTLGFKPSMANEISIKKFKTCKIELYLENIVPKLDSAKIIWRYFTISDSLGNIWCIDAFANRKDSLGRKQGQWKEYFRNYSDTLSGFQIGQIVWKGYYKDDIKEGEWTFYKSNGDIDRIEIYKDGKLIELKNN